MYGINDIGNRPAEALLGKVQNVYVNGVLVPIDLRGEVFSTVTGERYVAFEFPVVGRIVARVGNATMRPSADGNGIDYLLTTGADWQQAKRGAP